MSATICRAYKIMTEPLGDVKRGMFEISELPSRAHLLVSFTTPDFPQGVGVPFDRGTILKLVRILSELEARMEGTRDMPQQTRSITLPEGKRADDDDIAF